MVNTPTAEERHLEDLNFKIEDVERKLRNLSIEKSGLDRIHPRMFNELTQELTLLYNFRKLGNGILPNVWKITNGHQTLKKGISSTVYYGSPLVPR